MARTCAQIYNALLRDLEELNVQRLASDSNQFFVIQNTQSFAKCLNDYKEYLTQDDIVFECSDLSECYTKTAQSGML